MLNNHNTLDNTTQHNTTGKTKNLYKLENWFVKLISKRKKSEAR